MHSKQIGNIASSAVVLELQKRDFNIFSEIGDLSKIDIIAEKDGILKRIQVKSCKKLSGYICIPVKKSGPNGYRYNYKESDIDWFAAYEPKSGEIFWVESKLACTKKVGFVLRIDNPKNNQYLKINRSVDFDINRFLRDYTQNTCNGDDIVQTTTQSAVSES